MKKYNFQSKRIERDGRVFEFRFWDDHSLGGVWPYAEVVEILPKKHFWEDGERSVSGDRWGMQDRVQWCFASLEAYLKNEQTDADDRERIAKFCRQ